MKSLFALTILELINLDFRSMYGQNPVHIAFENHKGNTAFVILDTAANKVIVRVYKVTKLCCLIEIDNESQLQEMRNTIISKLKL